MRLRVRLCALLAACVLLVSAGCGLNEQVQATKIQDDLVQAGQEAVLGKTAQARQWADRAIAVAPSDVGVYAPNPNGDADEQHTSIAAVFTEAGDDASLAFYMKQAARKFPNSAWPLPFLVQAQGHLGDDAGRTATARTLAALLEARMLKPGNYANAAFLDVLGQAYFDAGDTVKGAAIFHRVLTTYPFDASAFQTKNELAYGYAVANDTPHMAEALSLAEQAVKTAQDEARQGKLSDENVGAIQDTLGWVQYRMGDLQGALSNLQQAMNNDPRQAENRFHLAMTYKALGQTEAARADFQRAVGLNAGYAAPARELATLPPPAPTPDARA